jgi:hypothetical protein
MGLVLLRLTRVSTAAVVLLFLGAVSIGQASPTPETIPLFGVSPERLAKDGIYAYPADTKEKVSKEAARDLAKGQSKREDKIQDMRVVNLKLPNLDYEGLAWAVRWDVDGMKAMWPGDGDLPPGYEYTYTFSLTFVDANSGAFLLTIEESNQPGT